MPAFADAENLWTCTVSFFVSSPSPRTLTGIVPPRTRPFSTSAFTDTVSPEVLADKGLIRGGDKPVKILAAGELAKKLTVQAHAFSKNAQAGIEAAGGSCEVVTS